jgi:hypothetical protein
LTRDTPVNTGDSDSLLALPHILTKVRVQILSCFVPDRYLRQESAVVSRWRSAYAELIQPPCTPFAQHIHEMNTPHDERSERQGHTFSGLWVVAILLAVFFLIALPYALN